WLRDDMVKSIADPLYNYIPVRLSSVLLGGTHGEPMELEKSDILYSAYYRVFVTISTCRETILCGN
ncbi:MAG TPA: hypothetical protein VJ022_16070, partial [Anaerolineales bacterium]|nr:hypothetical protein [Anaerolineales bacterium]